MALVWYVCPYDTVPGGPAGQPYRRPAIARYYPAIPNADGVVWDEAEVMGNHVVVKVDGPASAHTTIQADPDFREIPTSETVIANGRRAAIRQRLVNMGYTLGEIADTNWVVTQVLNLLTTARGIVRIREDLLGFEILPGRRVCPKTVADIEERLPG